MARTGVLTWGIIDEPVGQSANPNVINDDYNKTWTLGTFRFNA